MGKPEDRRWLAYYDMLIVYEVLAGEPPSKGHYGEGVVPLQLVRWMG